MIDKIPGTNTTLTESIEQYVAAWKQLLEDNNLSADPALGVSTTISVKVADKPTLFGILQQTAPFTEQIHVGTVNNRFIASVALTETLHGMYILKILERRPGSSDALGLDSVDYLVTDIDKTFATLQEKGLPVEKQHNDMHEWLSFRFGHDKQFEAKFTDHLVLHIGIKELAHTEAELLKKLDISRE